MTCYHSEQLTNQSANTSDADVTNATECNRQLSESFTNYHYKHLNRSQIKISGSPIISCNSFPNIKLQTQLARSKEKKKRRHFSLMADN